MNQCQNIALAIGLCVFAILFAGCGSKTAVPPPPMAVEDASASLQKAAQASPASKPAHAQAQAMLNEAVAALQAKDYPRALFLLQDLSGRSDLLPEQRSVVSSSMLAVNKALAEQASAGNVQAQQAIKVYRATK